jgi:hypothetical protein
MWDRQSWDAEDQRFHSLGALECQRVSPRNDVDGARSAAATPKQACHAMQFEMLRRIQVKNHRACFIDRRRSECRLVTPIQKRVPDSDLSSFRGLIDERGNAAAARVFTAAHRLGIHFHMQIAVDREERYARVSERDRLHRPGVVPMPRRKLRIKDDASANPQVTAISAKASLE